MALIVFLIGFMGAGKTTSGRLAAEKMAIPFIDLDEQLELRSGLSIPDFINNLGIEEFRRLESEILFDTENILHRNILLDEKRNPRPEVIVATGGGSVLSDANRHFMRNSQGEIIWLNPAWDVLVERLQHANRPLLQGLTPIEIRHLYDARLPFYQYLATVSITAIDPVSSLVNRFRISH